MKRQLTRPILVTIALAFAIACSPQKTEEPRRSSLKSLIETERDFSKLSADHGMKVAFLRYLDDEAILFRPHPVNGIQYTSLREDSGVQLSWEPTRAGVADSHDYGWTTGPYRVAPQQEGEPPLYGYFVSLWKRQKTDRWKVLMDLGTVNPADQPCPEEADLTPRPESGERHTPIVAEALLELEKGLSERIPAEGAAAVYGTVQGEETRLYRDDRCPAVDAAGIEQLLLALPGRPSWEPIEATASAAGDLAYSYGSYRVTERGSDNALEEGYYLRIWEAGPTGAVLRLEITSPIPTESE